MAAPLLLYTDAQLLGEIATGNEAAFNELFRRYWEELYNLAYRSLKDDIQAQEIVHDVLLEVWQRKTGLQIDNLPAYLKTAIRNRVINFVTRKKNTNFLEVFDMIGSPTYLSDAKLMEKDLLDLLHDWIEVLPEKRKKIFVKHFYDQLTTREIANELNISQKTVQNQVGNTLEFIRQRFGHLLLFIFFLWD